MHNVSNIVTCLVCCALLLSFGASSAEEQNDPLDGVRVLRFPGDRSLGQLFVQESDATSEDGKQPPWKELCEAKGDVRVPAGARVTLRYADERLAQDDPVADLSPLDKLRPTDLYGIAFVFVEIPPAELNRLQRHTSLRMLGFGFAKVDDNTLPPISKIKSLEVLNLPEASITDAGLVHLAALKNLKSLSLYGTKVTDQGVARLQAALPKLKIVGRDKP